MFESRMNSAPTDFNANKDLPEGLMDLLLPLHRAFTPRQRTLIAKRAQILAKAHSGDLPDHLPPSVATESDWRIELPEWCQDQRNQMTGPADDAELCVKMLNSAAPGVMLDLEDSMANFWCNLTRGISNILAALRGELSYFDKKRNEEVAIRESQTPFPNQAFARRPDAQRYPDLRPIPKGVGKISLKGTRAAVRAVIRYRNGVLNGKGATLLDGYMEDLATDRIYRLMIAQRIKHSEAVPIADEHGNAVKHTSEFITRLFDEELDRIIRELPPDADAPVAEKYRKARKIGERMIERGEFDPV